MIPALEIRQLHVEFKRRGSRAWTRGGRDSIQALRDISLELKGGGTLAIVGESGSGKTTLTRCVLGLIPFTGEVRIEGRPAGSCPGLVQAVFQDPTASLNPRMRIDWILQEPLRIQSRLSRSDREGRVAELLRTVSLSPGLIALRAGELSAGQRQRVAIARALATEPRILIADEPTASLDASLQVQIMNVIQEVRRRRGFSLLLVTHDLFVARRYCERIAVLRAGSLVEMLPAEDLLRKPQHPYTRELLQRAMGSPLAGSPGSSAPKIS